MYAKRKNKFDHIRTWKGDCRERGRGGGRLRKKKKRKRNKEGKKKGREQKIKVQRIKVSGCIYFSPLSRYTKVRTYVHAYAHIQI